MGLSNQSGGELGEAIAGALLINAVYEEIGYLCLGATTISALLCIAFARHTRIGGG